MPEFAISPMRALYRLTLLALFILTSPASYAQQGDSIAGELSFDDLPLKDDLDLPDWFNLSFLDLNDSLQEAIDDGKKGLIIYFGRKDCPYCKYQLEGNWGDPAIVKYTQEHFNVIAIDVRGDRTVTDFNGRTWNEKTYSTRRKTNFTPSLLFFNSNGQLALKLPGYRPKYQFRASLEYVADGHYQVETFRQYLSRAEAALGFGSEELNDIENKMKPPFILDRRMPVSKNEIRKPMLVLFEHPRCHACDVLHGDTLSQPEVIKQLDKLDIVQLDTYSQTPVITPSGVKTTAAKWAEDLKLTFAPALLFFDAQGNEVIRVESVIRLYRLNNVLRYVIGKEYENFPTFQAWLHHYRSQKKGKDK